MSGPDSPRVQRRERIAAVAKAAVQNEELTRKRVESLERWAVVVGGVFTRPFWGRLKWLLVGR